MRPIVHAAGGHRRRRRARPARPAARGDPRAARGPRHLAHRDHDRAQPARAGAAVARTPLDEEIGLRFVELNYGPELAAELAAYLRDARPLSVDVLAALSPARARAQAGSGSATTWAAPWPAPCAASRAAASTSTSPRSSRPQHVAPAGGRRWPGEFYVSEPRVRDAVDARRSFNAHPPGHDDEGGRLRVEAASLRARALRTSHAGVPRRRGHVDARTRCRAPRTSSC